MHECKPLELTSTLSENIDQIKIKYGFREHFDFHSWIQNILSWAVIFKEYDDREISSPRKVLLTRLISKTNSLIIALHTSDIVEHDLLSSSQRTNGDLLDLIGFKLSLNAFRDICESSLECLPKNSGNPEKTRTYRLLDLLIGMYKEGTENASSLYWNPYKDEHVGMLGNFVADILTILKEIDDKAQPSIDLYNVGHTTLLDYIKRFLYEIHP